MDNEHRKAALDKGHLPQPTGFRVVETGTKVRTPGKFTPGIAQKICERIMRKESLTTICKDPRFPSMETVIKWLSKPGEQYDRFREQYYYAKRTQAEFLMDEIIDIADDGSNDWMQTHNKHGEPNGFKPDSEAIQRSRLRIETRMRLAAKLLPKIYGDKIQHEHEATGDLAKLLEGAVNNDNGLPKPIND